uniref:Coiled-coil domain containing 14 n=1 Tax=Anolis carolinensis TaxID=28377 RepID=G1KKC3_ANOCA|nr:PREDICTED: coiled-coil domain-containing protein 14 [Anolis carolinensis]|eukprot:XP_008107737.1 PREDICTED: coiled-coil domain-containing protein 14 [Anolis carolinensis]
MARPGSVRNPKILSSGRLTGSNKITGGRKQVALRKVARSDVDCGYSLYSTDSEDQVANIHHGLDRCAALLKDILQNDSEGMETVCRKAGKAAVVRTTGKPLLSKVSSLKKRGPKKKTLSANVQKEILPVSTRKTFSGNVNAVGKDVAPLSSEQALSVQPVCMPCTQHSPVMHQKLCEQIQTQMSLLNMQLPQKSNNNITEAPFSIIPEKGTSQPVTAFNSRLPSSTPALSPQHAANPTVVQPGVSVNSCDQCAAQMGPTLLMATTSDSTSIPQMKPSTSCSALPHIFASAASDPTSSTFPSSAPSKEATSKPGNQDQWFKEADLIKCIQSHLAVLQAHENKNGKANEKLQDVEKCQGVDQMQPKPFIARDEDDAEEYGESTPSEEEDLNGVDIAPVRDTSCQTSFDKEALKLKRSNLQKTAQKIKTLKYLLGELKTLLTDHDDSEMLRLLSEVEDTVSLLPAVAGNTNVQAEIALALQPLRSENAQLRRRLRILNQQLKDQGKAKECNLDCNFELISLRSLNMTLQAQLNESSKSIESLQNKNEELIKILETQKEESKRLTRIIHERDQELLEKRQQSDIESTKLKLEADEALTNMKHFQYKLEAADKENQILGITLRQRDAEVNRLRELTRALRGSMSKLLADLTMDTAKPKQERSLSKAVLEIHEKQMQPEAYALSDSIMNYLKKLEIDPVLMEAEALFPKAEMKESNQIDVTRAAEYSSQKCPVAEEEIVAPRNVFTFLKPSIESTDGSNTLVEGTGLDETIYIPLSSSPSQNPAAATERRIDTHHQVPKKLNSDLANSQQANRFGMIGNGKVSDKLYSSYCPKKSVENKAETAERIAMLEGRRLQMPPKETTSEAAKVISDNPDRLHPDKFLYAPVAHQKGNIHNKDVGISAPDSSFSTFDWMSGKSEWTVSSFSTFTSRDEENFKHGLAALDANIARLQKTLQNSLKKTASP